MTYTKEELELMIHRMRTASNEFYRLAVGVGNHAFIEFAGLMNEYISVPSEGAPDPIKRGLKW